MLEEELRQNEIEREVLKHRIEALQYETDKLHKERRTMRAAIAEPLMKDTVTEAEVNYILGNSDGYIRGFKAAIQSIVFSLSSEYRDIKMTEDELHMLIDLGEDLRLAKIKDEKSRIIAEKAGWKLNFDGNTPTWRKTEDKE